MRELEYVQAARALGAPLPRVLAAPRDSGDVVGGHRAGDARHGGRDHRGGVAQLSRARRSAADAELGHDARRRPVASVRCAAPDDRSRPGDRACSCWASTSPATRCAIGSIRGADGSSVDRCELLNAISARSAAARIRRARSAIAARAPCAAPAGIAGEPARARASRPERGRRRAWPRVDGCVQVAAAAVRASPARERQRADAARARRANVGRGGVALQGVEIA